ncbi:Protein SIP5 [Neolecta irregularis DAH-3]|uniref:Protein SIP5 n=1 Tax=Neolecta irregularis (strain DAH-3) TaxID=1198029 RepID=A0A1U7LPR2_NEOID|nr:Protein SIP5 [Neolecta irregularis DAH-3]|eukprot:OLL24660.1 Protein SIP5 [Neolecta irregularis DAH-3]
MGVNSSRSAILSPTRESAEHIDGGYTTPQGVYNGPIDYCLQIVRQLQLDRKFAPFYRGLSDFDSSWSDAKLRSLLDERGKTSSVTSARHPSSSTRSRASTASLPFPPQDSLVDMYRGCEECPICFLFYPMMNVARCCSQPICSECFVQIKRAPPHRRNQETFDVFNEAPSCPYCTESDFGVVYPPPVEKTRYDKADERVIICDHIRPDYRRAWKTAKKSLQLQAANQAIIDQNNRSRMQSSLVRPTNSSRRRDDIDDILLQEALKLSLEEEDRRLERERKKKEEEERKLLETQESPFVRSTSASSLTRHVNGPQTPPTVNSDDGISTDILLHPTSQSPSECQTLASKHYEAA